MTRYLLGFAVFASALLGEEPPAKKYELKTMTPEQMEKDIDGLIDATGRTIRAAELPAYLKARALPPDAAYFLWITPTSAPLNTIAPTVKPLGDHGITKIVVRHRPEAVNNNRTSPPPAVPADKSGSGKIALIMGKPNPGAIDASAKFPTLEGRPLELRPEPLPRAVRYKFADDGAVVAAAKKAADYLLAPALPAGRLFGNGAMIQPGAWTRLQDAKLVLKEAKTFHSSVRLKRGTIVLDGASVEAPAELDAIVATLRQIISADGGGKVRALRSAEMAKWWVFIAFDIEEPVLVIETAGGGYLFVLHFTAEGLLAVDELNALPDPRR
jgi:hypothetical protein